jgi:uncharacterized protein with ATP-grasp and redox domains
VACALLKRAVELEMQEEDHTRKLAIYRKLLEAVNLYIGPDIEVAELATVSFRRLKSLLDCKPLYEDVIKLNLSKAMSRAKSIEESLDGKPLDRRIADALRAASLATGYRPFNTLDRILAEPPTHVDLAALGTSLRIGRDDTWQVIEKLYSMRKDGGIIYYAFGSVFELPYDAIVIRLLRDELGLGVIGIARSDRYEDYVTASDLEATGVADLLSEVIDIGSDAATVMKDDNEHVYEQLNEASLVIVKGDIQTLYFYNNPPNAPVLFLFAAPCTVLSKLFNVPEKSFNIILYEGSHEGGES